MKETSKIKSVSKSDDYFSISLEDSTCFGLDAKYGIEPKVGDLITLHTYQGCNIRGIDINSVTVFYKTDEQLEQERKEWLSENEKRKQTAFEKNKANMDKDYDELPTIFQQRIDRFRIVNPRFRVDYEIYELFCCKEAIKIANILKTTEALDSFRKAKYKQRRELVPTMSDGHSGNTFAVSCRLAFWYLTKSNNVVKEHGSLAILVGCDAYGCSHPKG